MNMCVQICVFRTSSAAAAMEVGGSATRPILAKSAANGTTAEVRHDGPKPGNTKQVRRHAPEAQVFVESDKIHTC